MFNALSEAAERLAKQASEITMYDVKSVVTSAKNMVLNIPEMQAKVLEATNNDAWGASSTLMQEIAQGTHNFQDFNEIMPTIYRRFMEKEAREWRQIYKALVLLEYLTKNGSERVVDDARSHVSTIKMLKNFHYIDEKGKDQGLNVRNRANELNLLLSDVDKIRSERRKARENRAKYTGVGNDGSSGGFSFQSGGSRYGGFGSDSISSRADDYSINSSGGINRYGESSSSTGHYGGSGGGSGFRDESKPGAFDEYDAGDDDIRSNSPPPPPPSSRQAPLSSRSAAKAAPAPPTATAPVPAQAKKATELLDFFGDDDDAGNDSFTAFSSAPTPAAPSAKGHAAKPSLDDDFGDFESSLPSPPIQSPSVSTTSAAKNDLFSSFSAAPLQPHQPPPNNFFNTAPISPAPLQQTPSYTAPRPNYSSTPSSASTAANKTATTAASGLGGFDDLWSSSLGSMGSVPKASAGGGTAGKTIKDLEREKGNASIWGAAPAKGAAATSAPQSTAAPATASGGWGGDDDLLL